MAAPGKLGKLAPRFPHSLATVDAYLTQRPPQPRASVPVPAVGSWQMDGNDQLGDCVFAGKDHDIATMNVLVGKNDKRPTDQQVVDLYLKLTGGQDTGYIIEEALELWQHTGLWGNKILGFAPVKHGSLLDLHLAIDLFGLADIGVQIPQSAMEQFDKGQPWTVVKGSPIEGGHDVVLVGYDAQMAYAVTWGTIQPVSYPWISTYCDEAWAVIGQEYREAGHGPRLDIASLEKDLAQLGRW